MKKWYHSKTLWVNSVALIAGIVQAATGNVWLDVATQASIVAAINLVLRFVTNSGLSK
jgi:hypothetical protein